MTVVRTLAARREKRELYRRVALAAADERERSGKSARGAHSDNPGGCANDGSGCLCECHDPRRTDS